MVMNPTLLPLPRSQVPLVRGESQNSGKLRLDHVRGSLPLSLVLAALDTFQEVSFLSVDKTAVLAASAVAISFL